MCNMNNFNNIDADLYAARIALVGNILSTLGDALQTIGAGIELQQLENENIQNANSPTELDELESMQKQIDELTNKIQEIEREREN